MAHRHLAETLVPYSVSRIKEPFFSLLLPKKRLRIVALTLRSPALRVWLPSRRCRRLRPLATLFQLPTLLGFALQSFTPFPRSTRSFEPVIRSRAFVQNSAEPCSGAPAGCSLGKSLAFLCDPKGLVWGKVQLLSWAFWPPRFSPLTDPAKRISRLALPLALSLYLPHGK